MIRSRLQIAGSRARFIVKPEDVGKRRMSQFELGPVSSAVL
jgi:hypothetical protein